MTTRAKTMRSDTHGLAIKDPTKNVVDLVWAASKYQDGMRDALLELLETKIAGLQYNITVAERNHRELDAAESRRVNEQLSIRATYDDRLTQAEAKRIDAIRAVDVNAVNVANQRAVEQASVLATQVAQSAEQLRTQVASSAETLRSLVATTAATAATTLQQIVNPIAARLSTLEQAQYQSEGKRAPADPALQDFHTRISSLEQAGYQSEGKRSLADPALAKLAASVEKLTEGGATDTGRKQGSTAVWALIGTIAVATVSIVGTLAALL